MLRQVVAASCLPLLVACTHNAAPATAPTSLAASSSVALPATQAISPPTSAGAATSHAVSTAPARGTARPGITKVLTIIEENHSLGQMQKGMPYLYGLAHRYGYATDYRAISHPSLPNYLAIAGGSTFGVTDDAGPAAHPIHGASVFSQALAARRTARLYVESLPARCGTVSTGTYAVKHAPWAYFVDQRAACLKGMVAAGSPAAGAFAADLKAGKLPTAGMLVPNLDDDAHDGTLAQADAWLKRRLPGILAGPDFKAGRLVVVVTADEDNSSSGNKVLTVVLAPGVSHRVVATPLSHYSLTRLYDEVIGAHPLRAAATAPSLSRAFGLHLAR